MAAGVRRMLYSCDGSGSRKRDYGSFGLTCFVIFPLVAGPVILVSITDNRCCESEDNGDKHNLRTWRTVDFILIIGHPQSAKEVRSRSINIFQIPKNIISPVK